MRRSLSGIVRLGAAGLIASLAVACGSNPTGPETPPPTDAPAIVCGPAVRLDVAEAPVVVEYTAPRASGGAAPLTTTCSTASGTLFPAGTTDVVCSATDAQQRRAQCVLQVVVSIAPQLKGTTFLAFGDSLTEGEVSVPATAPQAVEPHNSYPTALGGLLRNRYVLQADAIVVANRGSGGERAGAGEDRLVQEIDALRPDVLLFLEGTNDIGANDLPPNVVATSLRAGISRAYRRGVKQVFVSTLLPQVPGRHRALHPEKVAPFNDEIRDAAAREGAVLVDAFSAFDPQKELLIGVDGLHPTVEGYKLLAQVFMDAIVAHFELPPTPAAPQRLFTPPHVRR